MHEAAGRLGLIAPELARNKLFIGGLLLKLVLILVLAPVIQTQYFVSFLQNTVEYPSFDPWKSFRAGGGAFEAFPYGPGMLLAHLPAAWIGWFADHLTGLNYFQALSFRATLLLADLMLLGALLLLLPDARRSVVLYYWLSPLAIFITYWHGQTDVIPVTFFLWGLWLIGRKRYGIAGAVFAVAVTTKFSMLVGLPFVLLYTWRNKSARESIPIFIAAFVAVIAIVQGPLMMSVDFREMVLANREIDRLYRLAFDFGPSLKVYVVPVVFLLVVYFTWRLRRINFDLLYAVIGVAFSIIVLLTPAPLGWLFWLVPFYVIHQVRSGERAVLLVSVMSTLYIGYHFFDSTGASVPLLGWNWPAQEKLHGIIQSDRIGSIWYTLATGSAALVAIQIAREGIQKNDFYRLNRRPLVLGVAGDSGVGKDTFVVAMTKLFGAHSVVHVSCDDYHNWDRAAPMWQTMTHLDPRANRLFEFANDVRKLVDGDAIKARHYDHATGRFTPLETVSSDNVVIASGLHTLIPGSLHNVFDVRFYLDMDEVLRSHFKLTRDTADRGHSAEHVLGDMERRRSDSERFIRPQAASADVVFRLGLVNPEQLQSALANGRAQPIAQNLKLQASIRNGLHYRLLFRALVGVCGLQLRIVELNQHGQVVLDIQGDVAGEDIGLAVFMLLPQMDELLDAEPRWADGMLGVMQLIALMEINEQLKRRST